jgi:hypothetical protein
MDTGSRPPSPREDHLRRDPVHGATFIRLRSRHHPVEGRRALVAKGHTTRCATCRTLWPCEVGQALALVDWVPI